MQNVAIEVRNCMLFQHDKVSAYFGADLRTYLKAMFGAQWIGRGGPIAWPPRSPNLSSLEFLLWKQLKHLIYETLIDSDEDLVASIFKTFFKV